MQSTPNDNTVQSLGQTLEDFSATADMGDSAPDQKYSNISEFNDDLAPTNGQPNASNLEVRVADSMDGKSLTNEQSRTSLPRPDSLIQKPKPNPYRSIGDALDGWKERIKVSVDIEEKVDNSNDMVEDADEYGYTAEFEKGTAQALGPATADQLNGDITQNDNEMDVENTDPTGPIAKTELEKTTSDTNLLVSTAGNPAKDVNKQPGVSDMEGEPMEVDDDYNQERDSFPESVVSVKRSYMSEEIQQINTYSTSNDDHLGKANALELSADTRDAASALWRRYDILTTRLSQELAEQLRLIMVIGAKLGDDSD